MTRLLRRLLVIAAVAVACSLVGVRPAVAHTDLVGGSPGAGDVVAGPLADLTLTFTDVLLAEGAQIQVTDGRGAGVSGAVAVSGSRARVQLTDESRPGTYRVAYRVVANDGHPVTGSYRFRVTTTASDVRPAASEIEADPALEEAGPPVVATAAGPPTGPSSSTWVVAGLGVATLTLVLGIGSAGRRRPRDESVR